MEQQRRQVGGCEEEEEGGAKGEAGGRKPEAMCCARGRSERREGVGRPHRGSSRGQRRGSGNDAATTKGEVERRVAAAALLTGHQLCSDGWMDGWIYMTVRIRWSILLDDMDHCGIR